MIADLLITLWQREMEEVDTLPFDEVGEARFPRRADDDEEQDDPRGFLADDILP